MPIYKYIDETMKVAFGKGDVGMVASVDDGVAVLNFFQADEQHEVGEVRVLTPNFEPEVCIKLVFPTPETIDILIAQLIRTKEFSQEVQNKG